MTDASHKQTKTKKEKPLRSSKSVMGYDSNISQTNKNKQKKK